LERDGVANALRGTQKVFDRIEPADSSQTLHGAVTVLDDDLLAKRGLSPRPAF
jgi:hypothetical protein